MFFSLSIPPSVLLFWAVLTPLKHSTSLSPCLFTFVFPQIIPKNARAPLFWVPGYHSFRKWAVIYYLHGQTGRSTVWENANQNLGLVNVVTESRLPFVQISYICRKTATKAWNWYKIWLWRNGSWIPSRKNRDSVAPGNFPLERPRKSCSIYFPTTFSGTFL